jgi:hypothetical protein
LLLQFHDDWLPEKDTYTIAYIESTKVGVIVMLVIDTVLFLSLIMFVGLLRRVAYY